MTRAILHIGTEKTGTTALQTYLANNRAKLAEHGFWYSKAAGKTNHLKLYLYASEGVGHARTMVSRVAKNSASGTLDGDLHEDLANEVREHSDKVFVFSNEHCRGRLSEPQIVRLHELLSRFFDKINVLAYIRRQDELAVSHYSTLLKAGHTREKVLPEADQKEYFYDYRRFLRRWGSVFGEDNLTVRIFERGELHGGSVITDFCQATGIPQLPHNDKRRNQSLLPPYQEFLRQMNARLLDEAPTEKTGARIRLLRMLLVKLGSGHGRLPTREEAETFYRAYSESNEKVRRKFFPDRAALFDEDFSRYPEEHSSPALDLEKALDITAELWKIIAENSRFSSDAERMAEALTSPQAEGGPRRKGGSEARQPRSEGQPPVSRFARSEQA